MIWCPDVEMHDARCQELISKIGSTCVFVLAVRILVAADTSLRMPLIAAAWKGATARRELRNTATGKVPRPQPQLK